MASLRDVLQSLIDLSSNLLSKINTLNSNKADKSYVDDKMSKVDAITLNGYSLWVGTSEQLDALPEKDMNTLYFELDDSNENIYDNLLDEINNISSTIS